MTWSEVVELLKSIAEEEERNCKRAIVDEGPYKIGEPYRPKLEVRFSAYISKSHVEKEKINRKLHNLSVLFSYGIQVPSNYPCTKKTVKNLTECAYQNLYNNYV